VVLTRRLDVGRALRGNGLLLIPEEIFPPMVLRHAWMFARRHVVSALLVSERAVKPAFQAAAPAVRMRRRAN
jgi:membrane glycosyltransferase